MGRRRFCCARVMLLLWLSCSGSSRAEGTREIPVEPWSRYAATAPAEANEPAEGYEWEFDSNDIYALSSFSLPLGTSGKLQIGPADLGIGHCQRGATWAVIVPRQDGVLTSAANTGAQAIDHVWLRFPPGRVAELFPPDRVTSPGDTRLYARMLQIAQHKLRGSWHTGNRVRIPPPANLTVDVDTRAPGRRFFAVDTDNGTARYVAAFADSPVPPLQEIDRQTAQSDFDRLWQEFDREYAMFILRPEVDWSKLRDRYRPQALASRSTYEFAVVCARMLRHLHDLHVWVTIEQQSIPVYTRVLRVNANPAACERVIGPLHQAGNGLAWGRTADDIGFVEIRAWQDERLVEQFDEVLNQLEDTRGLIVDVRLNGGGSEPLALEVAGRFVDQERVYAFSRYRAGPAHTELTPLLPRRVAPRGPWRYEQPVLVLIGPKCMSSNESFIAMMSQCPQVTTMGETTCGASGNPKMIQLAAGISVSMPRWIDYLSDEKPLEGRGITPNVVFPTTPESFAGGQDRLLDAALERLRSSAPVAKSSTKEEEEMRNPRRNKDQDVRAGRPLSRRQATRLWETFCQKNRAWLDPNPPDMRYTLRLQRYDPVAPETYQWREQFAVRGWCAPGRNMKFQRFGVDLNGALVDLHEEYYAGGVGRWLSYQDNIRRLRDNEWLCARTGTVFLNSLHLLAWWGLPPATTAAEEPNGVVVFQVEYPRLGSAWWRDSFVSPSYGRHSTFSPECTDVSPVHARVEIDRETLRPRRVTETEEGGAVTTVSFRAPWLQCGDDPVPGEIECTTPRNKRTRGDEDHLTYRFDVQGNVWFVRELTCMRPHKENSLRLTRTELHVEKLAPDVFDLELPAHSETALRPGERIVAFDTNDGLTLEGKLSVSVDAKGKVPAVFFLGGAGPWTFDRWVERPRTSFDAAMYSDPNAVNYCGFYAEQLTRRGIAAFWTNKRGCVPLRDRPYRRVNRRIFAQATPRVLLEDYRCALEALRRQRDIDANSLVLVGLSEGTVLAPRLAAASPQGIAGIVMVGYVEDNTKDVVTWQNTIGPWRNVARLFDTDGDGKVTRQEFDAVQQGAPGNAGAAVNFNLFDGNRDGVITPADVNAKQQAEAIRQAVQKRDDDYLWQNVANLSSAYLLEDWNRPPNHTTLLKLNIPLAIFHGQDDGSCRVEGVYETQQAFAAAHRNNLTVRIYPKADHDLNWTQVLQDGSVPQPFRDVFATIEQILANR
jgi:pimeloyl-ACP methyl ester carboxylesterase